MQNKHKTQLETFKNEMTKVENEHKNQLQKLHDTEAMLEVEMENDFFFG